ncbi:MAG: DUF72 domain-containing protein [Candidatus Brockarchaeota archaeon]|nr:DUF72 domain-containing protein [Candidatus Brockarchaeota archaeon]
MAQAPIKVGTSGYSYDWNEGKPTPFEWYLKQGFTTVEVNASFYRFPLPSWAETWSKAPDYFDFSIKVHRSITHYAKLGARSINLWRRFKGPLSKLEDKISFWLFQLPSAYAYSDPNARTLSRFLKELDLGNKAVIEFRDRSWWRHAEVVEDAGACFCSVDAPGLPRDVFDINGVVYARLHGRTAWYSHVYTEKELKGIVGRIGRSRASKKYVYLNNDEGMLENGRFLLKISEKLSMKNPKGEL